VFPIYASIAAGGAVETLALAIGMHFRCIEIDLKPILFNGKHNIYIYIYSMLCLPWRVADVVADQACEQS